MKDTDDKLIRRKIVDYTIHHSKYGGDTMHLVLSCGHRQMVSRFRNKVPKTTYCIQCTREIREIMKTYTEEQFQNDVVARNIKLRDHNCAFKNAIVAVLKSKTPGGTDSEFTISEDLRIVEAVEVTP